MKIDTYEKAMVFYEGMKLHRAVERLSYILGEYPELWEETHQRISDLTGFERETVTRTLKILRRLK